MINMFHDELTDINVTRYVFSFSYKVTALEIQGFVLTPTISVLFQSTHHSIHLFFISVLNYCQYIS